MRPIFSYHSAHGITNVFIIMWFIYYSQGYSEWFILESIVFKVSHCQGGRDVMPSMWPIEIASISKMGTILVRFTTIFRSWTTDTFSRPCTKFYGDDHIPGINPSAFPTSVLRSCKSHRDLSNDLKKCPKRSYYEDVMAMESWCTNWAPRGPHYSCHLGS